jgi:ribosome biogenesis protein ENP2
MNVQKRNDVTIYNLSSGPQLPEWLGDRARRNLSKRDELIRRRIELIQDFQMPSSSSKVVQSSDGRYIIVGGTYPPRIRCYDVHDLTMKFERYVNSHIVDIAMLGGDYGKMAILQDDRTISFHAHYGNHDTIRIPKFGRALAYEPTTCDLLVAASGTQICRLNLEEGRFSEPWTMKPSSASATCISVSQAQPLATVGCDDGVVRFWDNRSPGSLLKPFLKLDVQASTGGFGFADADDGRWQHQNPHEIASVAHDISGLYMAVGTAGGLVALYDVRSSKPLHIKEHKHGRPIHTLKFHPGSGCVLSADEKLVKIWKYKATGDLANRGSRSVGGESSARFEGLDSNGRGDSKSLGAVVANVEGIGKFVNFITAGDDKDPTGNYSGLILCATDQPKLEAYYIPNVGLAPSWCSFLENVTEELEERDLKRERGSDPNDTLVRDGQETVFENYKFLSRDDLEKLGVSDLIGTSLLKAYMHGFFMDNNLYNKVRSVANPFEYEEYRKKKVKERVEAKRASRIAPKDSKVAPFNDKAAISVNPDLADRLQTKAEANTKAGKAAKGILSDGRFRSLFSNPDYEIDEDDENFRFRNPSGVATASATKRKRTDDMDSDDDDNDNADENGDGREAVSDVVVGVGRVDNRDEWGDSQDDDGVEDGDSIGDSQSSDDEDGFRGGKVRGEAYDDVKTLRRKDSRERSASNNKKNHKNVVMSVADDFGEASNVALHAGLGDKSASKQVKEKLRRMNMPLEQRFVLQEEDEPVVKITNKGGTKEITYVPKGSRRRQQEQPHEQEEDEEVRVTGGPSRRNRRGVNDLGFKTPFKRR